VSKTPTNFSQPLRLATAVSGDSSDPVWIFGDDPEDCLVTEVRRNVLFLATEVEKSEKITGQMLSS